MITDISLAAGDALAMIEEIRSGADGLPVVVLSMHDAPAFAERCMQAGASGYVSKQEMGEVVLTAIRQVLGGARYVSPRMRADR